MSSAVCYHRHGPGQETKVLLRSFAKFKYYAPSVINAVGNLVHASVVVIIKLVET
jgi:hypothetical protein